LFVLLSILASTFGLSMVEQFIKFQHDYGKHYDASETSYRFSVFIQNVKKISQMNQNTKGLTFGVNKFADLTQEEFKKTYLSTAPVRDPLWPVAKEIPEEEVSALPASFDWRTKGAVTGVKDQGQCGSCWAFSAVGNMEGQWFLSGKTLTGLSEQNLVDCDHHCMDYMDEQTCDGGCDGGLMPNAYSYVIANGGIDTEVSYPYLGYDNTCSFASKNVGAKIRNFTMVSSNETQMAAYLVKNGPLAIAANAEEWQFYIGGVFYFPCMTSLDHGILIVGYGVETDIFDETMPFWIVKNSWGEDWGESGYIRIERGTGKCGLNEFASSSIV